MQNGFKWLDDPAGLANAVGKLSDILGIARKFDRCLRSVGCEAGKDGDASVGLNSGNGGDDGVLVVGRGRGEALWLTGRWLAVGDIAFVVAIEVDCEVGCGGEFLQCFILAGCPDKDKIAQLRFVPGDKPASFQSEICMVCVEDPGQLVDGRRFAGSGIGLVRNTWIFG